MSVLVAGESRPSISDAISFSMRSSLLKGSKIISEISSRPLRFAVQDELSDSPIIAESRTLLRSSRSENVQLVLGKIENLRIAARTMNGIVVRANEVFSFWRHVGRPSKAKGYAVGREVREGCIIPTIGGGLCQLSNALYDAALQANLDIIERHAHTRVIQGSLAESNRDTTVFWNYIDLRFSAPFDFRVEIELTEDNLIVRFRGTRSARTSNIALPSLPIHSLDHDCMNCGVSACFRQRTPTISEGRAAYLLDAYWPEYDRYLQRIDHGKNLWYVPIRANGFVRERSLGTRLSKSYRCAGPSHEALWTALRRRQTLRNLPVQGSSLQRALLGFDKEFAASYARNIPFDVEHLVIAQNLLLPLDALGVLGGRTYDVLMTRLPFGTLQEALDRAKGFHPESATLGDFRVPKSIVDRERSLLGRARRIISPHAGITRRFPNNAVELDWNLPVVQVAQQTERDLIVFPYPAIARKGAYEMRAAAKSLGLTIGVLDRELEFPGFWEDCEVIKLSSSEMLRRAKVVVAPSFVEHEPRTLLRAIASHIPVIATPECGIEKTTGLTLITSGSVEALIASLQPWA